MLRKADRFLAFLETWALVVVVALLLVLAALEVTLKLLGFGIQWLEMLVRYMVLWVGFLGGAVASHEARHITIDVVTRFTKGLWRRLVMAVVNLVACGLALWLLFISFRFLAQKQSDNSIAFSLFGSLDVPEWLAAVIVPIGLFLMAFHFLVQAIEPQEDGVGAGGMEEGRGGAR